MLYNTVIRKKNAQILKGMETPMTRAYRRFIKMFYCTDKIHVHMYVLYECTHFFVHTV